MDGGRIIYMLDTGKIKTLKFPRSWFENTPQGKLMLHNDFGFSKYFVDSLSENTKRGLREKVRRGEFPCLAPFGYLNDYRTKRIIVDREQAALVKEAFERYATGEVTLDNLRHFFAEHNVHTRNGKMLTRGHITKMLSNPFYYGHFRYAGEVYEGTHEALISKRLFDEALAVLQSRYKWSRNHTPVKPKAFLGLLHCSTCGGAITAEVQKGHIYYRCTKKSRATTWCLQPYIREEDLDNVISDLLKPYSLRSDWADEMLTRVKEEKTENAQSARLMAEQKRTEIGKINLRLQTLLDSFLDGIIDRETDRARLSGPCWVLVQALV